MRIAILSLGLIAAVTGTARAGEEKVSFKEVPKAVRIAAKARFPEGKVTGAAKEVEGGETVYEVSLEADGQAVDLLVSAEGEILEVEKTIAARKLPGAVAATIKARFPRATIKKAEKVVKYEEDEDEDDEVEATKFFEVILAAEGKEDVEVKLSPKGKILDEGDEAEGDEGKAKSREGEDDDEKVKAKKKDGDKKAKSKKDKEDEDDDKGEGKKKGKG